MVKKPPSLKELPSIRQLRAFVAVYQTGSLSAAADLLALTQPAVTVLLRELETKLGVRLFDRTTRMLRRTEAAAEAIGYAERALAELTALGTSMADLADTRRGRVRIAATSTVAQTVLPDALRRFREQHPLVKVSIEDCAPREFVERLLGDQVDCGVGTLEAPVPGLREQVFLQDSLVAAGTEGLLPGTGRTLSWKQLAGLPVITVKSGYGVRSRIDRAAAEAGMELSIEHEVSLLTTAVALAGAGLGVAVVPGSVLTHATLAVPLQAQRLVRPHVERSTAVISRNDRSLSPAAAAFAQLLTGGRPRART